MARGTSFNMEEEFAGLDFHSVRLEGRFVKNYEDPDTSARYPGLR
jgi:hypothetical protein